MNIRIGKIDITWIEVELKKIRNQRRNYQKRKCTKA